MMRSMVEPIDADPPADRVRRITFVPFLSDGRCALIEDPGGPALPSGEVADGEDYVLDTVLRVPLETAGFRYQRFHPFGLDGDHPYAWIEGAPYTGSKPHGTFQLTFLHAEDAAERVGDPALAAVIRAAARSYRRQRRRLAPARRPPAAPETLRSLGFRVAGQTSGGDRPGRVPLPTAWITASS